MLFNPVSIHLMLNHVPLIGSFIATLVLTWGLFRRQQEIIGMALIMLIVSAVAALPVFFSGEGAEDAVKHLPAVSHGLIEAHENIAKLAIGLIEGLGLAAVGGLIILYRQQRLPLWYAMLLAVLCVANGGAMAQTAHLGGQIRHSEVRGLAESVGHSEQSPLPAQNTSSQNRKDHDDDSDHDETDQEIDRRSDAKQKPEHKEHPQKKQLFQADRRHSHQDLAEPAEASER